MMRDPLTSSAPGRRTGALAGAPARTTAQFVIGPAIVVLALSLPLYGQDPDPPLDLEMLDMKVLVLTQQVTALQQKVATLQQQGSRVKAPFEVVDVAGKTLVKIEAVSNGHAAVTVGSGAGGVTLGVGASGAGAVLVRRADGKVGAEISQRGDSPMGVFALDAAGQKPVAGLRADSRGNGIINVGDAANGGVTIGVGASSGAGAVVVRRADGKVGVEISQQEGPMGVLVYGTAGEKPVAELGVDSSGGGSVTVTDSTAKPMFLVAEKATARDARVSIGAGDGAYGLNVASTSGTLLAALGEAKNGAGRVATFDRSGALRAVMNGLHGEVHVVDASGNSRATMVTDNGQGAFSIRNASGTTVLRLGEGAQSGGLLQLADSGGNATVEAGTLPGGAGVVRAHPVGLPGTFIMGHLGQGK